MLKQKLENISKVHKEEKESEAQQKENERLAPIRKEIKDLEKKTSSLELLYGSLTSKSGEGQEGIGMEEYASDIEGKMVFQEREIENAFHENKEALEEKVGIKSKEDLISHPDFAEEEEVKSYKSAKKNVEELDLTDRQLKNRLTKFGIDVQKEGMDYKALAEEVAKKIPEFKKELFHKKIETPEGKEEVLDLFAKEIGEQIPGEKEAYVDVKSFSDGNRPKELESFGVSFDKTRGYRNNNPDVGVFYDVKSKKNIFKSGGLGSFLAPDILTSIGKEYGWEIAKEAQRRAVEKRIDGAFDNLKNDVIHLDMYEKDIEAWSPKKSNEAVSFLRKIIEKRDELGNRMDRIQSEQKIRLVYNWGSSYTDGFVGHRGDEGQVLRRIQATSNEFPPSIDYGKVVEVCKKQEEFLKFLEEKINGVKTQEDANRDFGGLVNRKKYEDILSKKPDYVFNSEKLGRESSYELKTSEEKFFAQERGNIKNYEEAKEYVAQKKEDLRKIENELKEKALFEAEKQLIQVELVDVCQKENLKTQYGKEVMNFSDVKYSIEGAKNYENACQRIVDKTNKFFEEIPKGHLVSIDGLYIFDATAQQEREKIFDRRKGLESELEQARVEAQSHLRTKPGLFKKKEWEDKKNELEGNVESIKQKIEDESNNLRKFETKSIGVFDSYTSEEIKNSIKIENTTPEEAEVSIKIAVQKIIEKHQLPQNVIKLWEKYNSFVPSEGKR